MITTTCTDSRYAVVHGSGSHVHTERAPSRVFPRRDPIFVPPLRVWLAVAMLVVCATSAKAQVTIVHDTFSGAALASHQPDTNLPNGAWTVTGSGATLWNHFAWAAGADWSGILATIDSGVADGTVAVDWTPSGDSPYGGIVVRATDAANYLLAYYWAGTLYLSRIASAGNVLLASTTIEAPGTATHRLKIVLAGASIHVWYDGTLRLSATDAFNIAATKHGFRWLSYYDWMSTYSNFEVDGVFVPTAATTSVAPTSPQVPLFQSITLTATARDAANHVIPGMSFSWSTSNATAVSIASLNANSASVTGVGAGGATITATPLSGSGSTATVTVNTGPVSVYDTFVGATGTALSSHAPEVNTSSGTWSTNGSGAVLSGSRAAAGGADWDPITATIDSGLADGVVEVDWTPGGLETPAATIVARMTDSANYLLAHYWAEHLWLYRVDHDHYSLLGQSPVIDAGTATHHLTLKFAGAALEVWWDDIQEIVASDAFNSTATRHGFRWYSWWDWLSTYDRFEVSALPTIASVTIAPSSTAIPMNGGRVLTAQALDAAGNPIPGVSFAWQSFNPSIVSTRVVSATMGALIAEGVGSATVTATAFGGAAQQTAAVTVTAPPPPPPAPPPGCANGVFPASVTWPADGGIGQLTLSAPSNCEWAVEWNAPWITPLQTSGSGDASVSYAIDRNESGVPRSGLLTVGGAAFTIGQTTAFTGNPPSGGSGDSGNSIPEASVPPWLAYDELTGAACVVTMTPDAFKIPVGGGNAVFSVNAGPTCKWRITGLDYWLSASTLTGVGPTMLTVTGGPASATRLGRIIVGGQSISVVMQPVNPGSQYVNTSGNGSCDDYDSDLDSIGDLVGCIDESSSGSECGSGGVDGRGVPIVDCTVTVPGAPPSPDPLGPEPIDWCTMLPNMCGGVPDPCASAACYAPPQQPPSTPQPATSLEIRCRPAILWMPFGTHCYAVTWDPDRGTSTIQGGPSNDDATGALRMRTTPGWPTGNNQYTDPVYYRDRTVAASVIDCLAHAADLVDALQADYHPVSGPNSNSGLNTTLRYCGLRIALAPDAIAGGIDLFRQ